MTDADLTRKAATTSTAAANDSIAAALPTDDTDFALVARGRIAPLPGPVVHPTFGHDVWSLESFAFLDQDRPPSVNPSLWRQARLNAAGGLFEVVPGVYQVRGIDLSNITFLAGDTGWIVIDPLSAAETARAALDLVHAHLPERPIHAVIYTHSHVDHYGGVRGIVDEADVDAGRIQILAPEGFLAAAISENVIAGPIMNRRATYMYGPLLPRDPQGHVDCGLGKAIPLLGTPGLIAPTVEIGRTGEELVIDGLRIVFQMTPDTEAPAEMNFFFPDLRLLCMAENCSANLHNVYTPRGAQIRDALGWSKYINEAIELFADDTDTVFMSHHWPRWGHDEALTFLRAQRDAYRFLHDETMRMANHGLVATEIAEELRFPEALAATFHVRDYYGTLNHDLKAIYQFYLGWWDGNPAHYWQHPPEAAGARYVEAMGGIDATVAKAKEFADRGDLRFAAELASHAVFAEPLHDGATELLADVLTRIGYGCEAATWRNIFLTGALELSVAPKPIDVATGSMIMALTVTQLFDTIAVRIDGERAWDKAASVRWQFTDSGENYRMELSHGALVHYPTSLDEPADLTLTLTRRQLLAMLGGAGTTDIRMEGNPAVLAIILDCTDQPDTSFSIVSP